MSSQPKTPPRLVPLLIDGTATFLTVFVLIMDSSAFLFCLSLGVFDNHWSDVPLPVIFVCLIISYLFLLLVAAMYGLAKQLSTRSDKPAISVLMQLGPLIDEGWERALRITSTSSMVVLVVLVIACLCWWRDLLWWSEVSRGIRADSDHRYEEAFRLYQASTEISSPDRVKVSQVMLATLSYDLQRYAEAEQFFNKAIVGISNSKPTKEDNRSLLITAYQGLCKVLLLQHKYHEAESAARKCLALFPTDKTSIQPIYLRLVGDLWIPSPNPPPTIMGTYTLLEQACLRSGDIENAKKAFAENLGYIADDARATAGEVIGVTNLYADSLADLQPPRIDLIEGAFAQAEALIDKKFGHDVGSFVAIETKLGDRLKALGQPDKAEKRYKRAIDKAKEGNLENYTYLRAMNGLADIYATSDRIDQAEQTYKLELAVADSWKSLSSDEQIEINSCRTNYANLLRSQNKPDEANQIQSDNSGAVEKK